jgi:phosphoglycerate dehydrogenase-like enzyme
MKIAFLHENENEFNTSLLRELRERLSSHEILSWIAGEPAPSNDLDILVANSSVRREQLLDQRKLALIQTATTGYETVDIDAATSMGIWVSYAPSDTTGNATSVAEFAILLLLGAARQIGQVIESLHGGPAYPMRVHPALNGKTVCIVGLGSIGRQIVDRLRPFGVLILATDEHPENAPKDVTAFPSDKLDVAVADADFVVICARASKENEGMIGASILRGMKRGAILVNVARGLLIDEPSLLAALDDGRLAAAGLDVVRNEPLTLTNPLLKLSQVLLTPHVAAFTDLMLAGTVDYICQVVGEFESGRKPESILNVPSHPRSLLAPDRMPTRTEEPAERVI